jgi:hypothetical protein
VGKTIVVLLITSSIYFVIFGPEFRTCAEDGVDDSDSSRYKVLHHHVAIAVTDYISM